MWPIVGGAVGGAIGTTVGLGIASMMLKGKNRESWRGIRKIITCWHIRCVAVCNKSDCESQYRTNPDVTIAVWCGGDGLRRLGTLKPLNDGDLLLCQNCGSQYEMKAEWPRFIAYGSPAVPKFYGW